MIKYLIANGGGLGLPFLSRTHPRHVRHTGFIEHLHLFQREIHANNLLCQRRRHLLRRQRLHIGHPFFLRQCRLQERRPTSRRPAHLAFLFAGLEHWLTVGRGVGSLPATDSTEANHKTEAV